MNRTGEPISRRNFLQFAGLGFGSLALRPFRRLFPLTEFPTADRLGRVNSGKVDIKARPDADSPTIGSLYEDAVVAWLREVIGSNPYRTNRRYVETQDGYIWAPDLQPVRNLPNEPVSALPPTSRGSGMWVEISVPYVDMLLDNPPARSPRLKNRSELGLTPRMYYSQITWVDQIKTGEDGQIWYRINEPYGSYGDMLWARGEAFRPLTLEEMAPIRPDVEHKRVQVNIAKQTLSCYEGNSEVYYTRISSGALWNAQGKRVDAWATPIGTFPIWRKLVSLHMSGGTTGGGWDLPGIGWVSLFVGSGVAVHSTFWHNNWGEPMSRGCVNATPEDARWVFRWTQPAVPYDPGDTSVPWPGGTKVEVVEE
jgi:L,D-transpeptidase catalytic domain